MNKRSDDYIPYASEIEAARDAAAARIKDIPDPRHEYVAKYTVNGSELTENILAYSIKEAEEQIKQQLSMVGWYPLNLEITPVDNTNVNVG